MEYQNGKPEEAKPSSDNFMDGVTAEEQATLTVDDILATESVIPRLKHPEIIFSHANAASLNRLLAEELYQLMVKNSAMCVDTNNAIDGVEMAVPTAPLVHVASKDGVIDGSLRIQSVFTQPIECSEILLGSEMPTREYLVFQLDSGTLLPQSKSKQKLDEDDFTWRPYIYAVINQSDLNNCSIHSPEKGLPELGGMDLVMAAEVVEYMRTELLAKDFKRDAPHDQMEKVTTVYDRDIYPDDEEGEILDDAKRVVDLAQLEPFNIERQLSELVCFSCMERDITMCSHGDSVTVLN